ncbi:putative hydrolase/acyltransferase (alpha/beta hydrolase superfamily) [Handroanthus impetiginosus]|uniref:Putative hydrolase/acyltransferase (Alpha/beta hydrolase superfamily) n=1 Tax=Handroanthus impetiginosus TaxID=429701 RepID=A0A2G9GD96_9LAMI|nr:putative hydrolase/acyltransferase (alpha/beta hydrolase superfamily) [Handroanthus impetiginosus]
MSEVNESTAWGREFPGLFDEDVGKSTSDFSAAVEGEAPAAGEVGDWRFQVAEFAKGAAEMSVEFGKGVRDVVKQSILREDSVIVRKFKGPCLRICRKLRFLNEYLPEDRDPVHAWSVIAGVWVVALAAILVNANQTTTPLVQKMKMHPATATLILLPDGRHLAYQERGVPADEARYSMIVPHYFLSSRLAGIPGLKDSLLQDFGVRLVTYDLPGFGESDPHPGRNLESSAMDMLHLSNAVNVTGKFWVVGYSDGSMHAWASLRYIPDKLEGAIMVAPMVNPYDPRLTKGERQTIWGKWTARKRMMYLLARKFPRLLTYFYRRSFLSGSHGPIDKLLSVSLGKRDRALVEDRIFEEFWQRDVEESVRQANVKPFLEEAALQVSDWGFSIADLKVHNKHKGEGFLVWLRSLYSLAEERVSGSLGPIHIWQGAEDTVVPPSMSDFIHRVLPDVTLHKLPYDGHFTYFYFCDECHQQIFTTVYGIPQGPLAPKVDPVPTEDDDGKTEVAFSDITIDRDMSLV